MRINPETICLPHKPHSPLSYQFAPGYGPQATSHLVVCLNGLVELQDGWLGALDELDRIWTEKTIDLKHPNKPPMLTYDRYGQGKSARDPADDASDDGTHDIREVVSDLYKFVHHIYHKKILPSSQSQDTARSEDMPRLILVAHSIGCVIARLFAAFGIKGYCLGALFFGSF